MRDVLPEFYLPTDDEFRALWRDAVFAFDANVLLDVYRYSPGTSAQLLSVLKSLGDQVWVPYQAALEYQQSRLGVCGALLGVYDRAAQKLDMAFKEIQDSLSKYADSRVLLKSISGSLRSVKRNLERTKEKHATLVPAETLHDQLSKLLDGKVGSAYSETDLKAKYKEAEQRFKDRVPPGYKDSGKQGDERFGDFVLWSQTMAHAKATKKPIILVTGDQKEDWWWEERGKTIGPRPELRREMRREAGVEFYLYSTERFLDRAREYTDQHISDEAIAEARDVRSFTIQYTTPAETDIAYMPISELGSFQIIPGASRLGWEVPSVTTLSAPASSPNTFFKVRPAGLLAEPPMTLFDVDGEMIRVSEMVLMNSDGVTRRALRFQKGNLEKYAHDVPSDWSSLPPHELLTLFYGGR